MKLINLQSTSVVLHQYYGTILPTLSELRQWLFGKPVKSKILHCCDNADDQLLLLGCDWLSSLFRLAKNVRGGLSDGPRKHAIHSAKWLSGFPDVMDEILGLLRGIKAETSYKKAQ